MKTKLFLAAIGAALLITASAALAGDKTVELKVEGMTCESCPYMVTTALKKVDGVKDIKISLADKSATVTYDDAKTNLEAVTDATFAAGFPSRLKGTEAPDDQAAALKYQHRGSHAKKLRETTWMRK